MAADGRLIINGDKWDAKSYSGIRTLRESWRLAGGNNDVYSEDFNVFDTPGDFYFRVFFDFTTPGGLLYTGGDSIMDTKGEMWGSKNAPMVADSALNYLMVNGEWERAEMLKNFIKLLSNIVSRSPWYFISLAGLDALLAVPGYVDPAGFKIAEGQQLTINCMPDAYDNRIGTLLDLYKAITFSHRLDKVILPENLRLFNMYIYIFNTSIGSGSIPAMKGATFDQKRIGNAPYVTSSKLIELHGCEFNPNANATGYATIDNTEGFQQQYTITIQPKKVYEQRYNELLMRKIGDMVLSDLFLDERGYTGWGQSSGKASSGEIIPEDIEIKDPTDIYKQHEKMLPNPQNADLLADLKGANKNIDVPDIGLGDSIRVNDSGFLGTKIGSTISKFAGDVKTVGTAIASTIQSYSPSNLVNVALNSAGDVLNKLTFGNLFHTSINDVVSQASSKISEFSADALASKTVRGGWKKVERTSPTGRSLGGNIFKS